MQKSNLLIPIAGLGSRFPKNEYVVPKPMIMIDDRSIIEWSVDCVDRELFNLIFIVREEHVSEFGIDQFLRKKFGENTQVVIIKELTEGAVCTCLAAKDLINDEIPLYIHCSDVYFEPKLNTVWATKHTYYDGGLLVFKSNSTNYSYSEIGSNGYVTRTAEKKAISDFANVGIYYFKTGNLFVSYAEKMIDKNLRTNNEFYIAPLYNLLIQDEKKIVASSVEKMHIFGTPEELNFFKKYSLKTFPKNKNKIALCGDHSGYITKQAVKEILVDCYGLEVVDYGPFHEKDCDYTDYVKLAAKSVIDGTCDLAFGFCRTGQGVNIAANKIKGIRSALVYSQFAAEQSVRHNCANFFAIPEREFDVEQVTNLQTLKCCIKNILESSFDGGRHQARLQKNQE